MFHHGWWCCAAQQVFCATCFQWSWSVVWPSHNNSLPATGALIITIMILTCTSIILLPPCLYSVVLSLYLLQVAICVGY